MKPNPIELTRQEASEHLENFLLKGLNPLFQKGEITEEEIQKAHQLYDVGIDPHGCLYPINRLWCREAVFTSHGLSPKTVKRNLTWTQKLLKVLQRNPEWEKAEQEICTQFGGYGYIPQEGYPPTLTGFRDMVKNLTNQEEEILGFATYLPNKIHLNEISNQTPSKINQTEKEKQEKTQKTLSENQKQALKTLEKAHQIFTQKQSIAGISLRSPLLIGASGGGKTTIVRALAQKQNLPYILLDGADWILSGAATEPQSLQRIRSFVQTNEKGIIAIDECDKLGTAAEDGHAWWRSVRGEIMTVIEKRSDNWAGWSEEEKTKFQKNFFVVGLGTWQHLFRKKSSMGFNTENTPKVDYEEIKKDGIIPEELLARFGKPIVLQPLRSQDYKEILQRIHKEFGKTPENLDEICNKATSSGKEYRWVEDYVSDLLFSTTTTPTKKEGKSKPIEVQPNPEQKTTPTTNTQTKSSQLEP